MKVQPLARQASLIVKELPDETLVYDQETDKAHCLNQTAASVWKNCDGQSDVGEIAARLGAEANTKVDESVVWLALDQLQKFKLLDEAPVKPAHFAGISRRQVMARLGIAAVALPAIISIVSPVAYAQGSQIPPGFCCVNPNDCFPGKDCIQDPPGQPCTVYPPNPQNSGKLCEA